MSDKKVIVVGYSGHAYTVIETAESQGLIVKYYTEKSELTKNPFSLHYLGNESNSNFDFSRTTSLFILGIGDNKIREKVATLILSKNGVLQSLISPEANVSKYSVIGKGVLIVRGANINAFAEIGDYSILNTGCSIDHACSIGKSVHIAPGAVLAGGVKVGDRSFIGANSVIKQGVTIGKDVIIGAGTVVLKDIPNDSKVVGNPGRIL